jgi:hypothetical protein
MWNHTEGKTENRNAYNQRISLLTLLAYTNLNNLNFETSISITSSHGCPCAGQQPLHIQNDMHAGPGVQRLRPSVRQALRWPWLTSAPVGAEKMRSSGRRLQITANPAVLKTNPPATSVGQNLTLGPRCPPRPTCQFPALLDHHCPTPCPSAARVAQGPSVAPRCSGSDPGVRAHHRRD